MPIEDVADLVARWQRARSPAERARVAAAGTRTLRGLSTVDRRVLAQGLAERGAPEAAAQLERYGAGALGSRQLTELAASLRSVEPSQLEGLAASLADPAERRRLARAAAESVVDGGGPPPPTGPPLAGPDAAPPPAPTDAAVPLPPPLHAPDAPDGPDAGPDLADGDDEPEATVAGTRGDPDGADEWVLEPTHTSPGAVVTTPTPATFDPAAALADIDRAGSVQARLAAARSLAGTPLTSDGLTAVLHRVPDGWQRRTVARRLLAAGGVTDVDAEQVLTSFERRSDRTAIAHVLVDRDLAHVETVVDHLDPGAAERLRRRTRGAA